MRNAREQALKRQAAAEGVPYDELRKSHHDNSIVAKLNALSASAAVKSADVISQLDAMRTRAQNQGDGGAFKQAVGKAGIGIAYPNTLAEIRRDFVRLRVAMAQIKEIEAARLERLEQAPGKPPHAMTLLLARVKGIGIETADMLVHEVLSRQLRDRRAVARYAGLTGAPDESGSRRREKGLARTGNARVRCGMIQLAWRFLMFQKDSALAQWYRARTADARSGTRKTMIVALARKLLIALWRLVTTGEVPQGVVFRTA